MSFGWLAKFSAISHLLLEAAETFHKAVQVTKDELYNIGPLDRIWVRFGGLLEYKIFVTTDQLLTRVILNEDQEVK